MFSDIPPLLQETTFMKSTRVLVLCLLILCLLPALVRAQAERIDTAVVAKIKAEGLQNSKIMELLSSLCDVYSPRLSWSPEYRRGAEWAGRKLKEWGMQNITYDYWAPLGKGWSLRNFSAMVTAPVPYPVIAYPAAWSPGFSEKEAEVVFLDARTTEDLEKYKGKLKGKFVLVTDPVDVKARFEPLATRLADSALLRMANADLQSGRRGGRRGPRFDRLNAKNLDSAIAATAQTFPDADTAAMRRRFSEMQMNPRKLEYAQKEGALAAISASQGDGGDVLVQAASVPRPADAPPGPRVNPYDPKVPEIIPQIVFAAEQYNRIVRMLRQGEKVKLEMDLQVATTKADSGFNILAEIPGTDLKGEVVMLGAHFDTWHGGTGATDDNTGTAACMEAMRILQVLAEKHGLKPRRTIRIGLWGAEEQGLIGSREYVSQTYARRDTGSGGSFSGGGGGGAISKTGLYDSLSVYFNHDNGTGRIRGVYLQGNEAARPIFRSLFTAFGDPAAQTITIQNTGGTDHQSFDGVGLPGFQFIQDPIDYDSRTHHYTMDVYDRIQEPDMKQAATMMALFAYQAATRDARFPRKPVTPGGSRQSP
jgi:carboxypeptidase Q